MGNVGGESGEERREMMNGRRVGEWLAVQMSYRRQGRKQRSAESGRKPQGSNRGGLGILGFLQVAGSFPVQ